jgi:hypothetical protein
MFDCFVTGVTMLLLSTIIIDSECTGSFSNDALQWLFCRCETPASSAEENYCRLALDMPHIVNTYVHFWK